MALNEVNELNAKKIQDLEKKVQELESENEHLSMEHLAILKRQDLGSKKEGEQSTMADTRTNSSITMTNEDLS